MKDSRRVNGITQREQKSVKDIQKGKRKNNGIEGGEKKARNRNQYPGKVCGKGKHRDEHANSLFTKRKRKRRENEKKKQYGENELDVDEVTGYRSP